MREYTALHITYKTGIKDEIKSSLPERAERDGYSRGLTNPSDSYKFNPPLKEDEIIEITRLLCRVGAKSFTFEDTASLGKSD